MKLRSFLSSALALAAFITAMGCPAAETPFDPMDPMLMGARLVLTSPAAVTLGPSETAQVTVRYEREDGSPVADAPIMFELTGAANGAMLAAREATTVANTGVASMSFTSGTTSTMFQVVATGPLGETVTVEVAVATMPAGNITVQMRYMGSNTLTSFEPLLFRGMSCTALNPAMLPTADRAAPAVTSITATSSFAGLVPANDYAVAVRGTASGMLRAFGCVDSITVQDRMTAMPIVILRDAGEMQPRFDGTYDLESMLDLRGTLPPSVATGVTVLDELTDDNDILGSATGGWGQDPGAFIVDVAMRQTCAWECRPGEDYSACSSREDDHPLGDLEQVYTPGFIDSDLAQSSFTGGCTGWGLEISAGVPLYEEAQNLVNEQIERLVPDVALRIAAIAGDLARAFSEARVRSVLLISPTTGQTPAVVHELTQWVVRLHDLEGVEHSVIIDLSDAGLTALRRDVTATVDGTTLTIPEHTFTLNAGRLLLYIYRSALLPLLGVTSTGELLASWIDCPSLAVTLSDFTGALISEATLTSACTTGLSLAGSTIERLIGASVDAEGSLTLTGTTMGADFDAMMRPARLVNGAWEGAFAETAMSVDLTGTFVGIRRP